MQRERLSLVVFRSDLSAGGSVDETHRELLEGLRKDFELSLFSPGEEEGKDGLVLAFIASGGSENAFRAYYGRLPRPTLLLTDGLANSLAAALEILSWIREMGGQAEILHGSPEYIRARVEAASAAARARESLAKAKIGVIGFPSEWLISSAVDYAAARRRWGSVFTEIEMGALEEYISREDGAESSAEAEKAAEDFARGASKTVEPGKEDLVAAARVYLALKKLAADYGLDALTLKCFDILDSHKTTGCMALALLNQEGITAGCEGDERTVFTMHLARLLTGEVPFMANPSQIDAERNSAIFAHCTIAPCLTREYRVRSHFESGIGVGIQGIVPEGAVTVLKVGGSALDRYFVSAGRITANLDDPRRCRTQLKVDLDEDASYFLRAPLANHHVIVKGDREAEIVAFMEGAGATRSR
jgi:L-fucose isomerase-like protein